MNSKAVWIGGGLIAAVGVVAFLGFKSPPAAEGAAGSLVGAAPSPECARAVKSNLDASGMQSVGYRMSLLNGGYAATEKQYDSGDLAYDVAVRDSKTGAVVTTFKCSVGKDGAVVELLRAAPEAAAGQGPTAARN